MQRTRYYFPGVFTPHYPEHLETMVLTGYVVFMKATRALHTLLPACWLLVHA